MSSAPLSGLKRERDEENEDENCAFCPVLVPPSKLAKTGLFRTYWDGVPDLDEDWIRVITELESKSTILSLYMALRDTDWAGAWFALHQCDKLHALNQAWRVPHGFGNSLYGVVPVFISEVIHAGNVLALEFLLQFDDTVSSLTRTSALVTALGSGSPDIVALVVQHWFVDPEPPLDLAQCIRISRISSLAMLEFLNEHPFFKSVHACQYIAACCYLVDDLEENPERIEVMKHVLQVYPLVVASHLHNTYRPYETFCVLRFLLHNPIGPTLVLSPQVIGYRLFIQAILEDDLEAVEWYIIELGTLACMSRHCWKAVSLSARSAQMCALLLYHAPDHHITDLSTFTSSRLEDLVDRSNSLTLKAALARCLQAKWTTQIQELATHLCATGLRPAPTDVELAMQQEEWYPFIRCVQQQQAVVTFKAKRGGGRKAIATVVV